MLIYRSSRLWAVRIFWVKIIVTQLGFGSKALLYPCLYFFEQLIPLCFGLVIPAVVPSEITKTATIFKVDVENV